MFDFAGRLTVRCAALASSKYVKEAIDMNRYKTEHSEVDVGIPMLPMMAKKTIITDTKTGTAAKGLDWSSFQESDRKAWEALKKNI